MTAGGNEMQASEDSSPLKKTPSHSVLRQGQFRLIDLFCLTTATAIVAGATAAWGLVTLVPAVGLICVAANAAGYFLPIQQTPRLRGWFLCFAWGCFLVSLFLPAILIFNEVSGWQCAWVASMLWLEPFVNAPTEEVFGHVLLRIFTITSINLHNLLLVTAPVGIWLDRKGWLRYTTNAMLLFAPVVWMYPILFDDSDMQKIRIGYYVWALAPVIYTSCQRPHWMWWALMVVETIFVLGLHVLINHG